MRLKMVYLENYAGILNGMGLDAIAIDFTKCKHNMLVIKGDNGSGKSTLFKSLKPLPDDSDMFIANMPAKKIIEYFGDAGEIYSITFIHDIKSDGSRVPTKGYISKNIGSGPVELNPNGNITSCKDIIFAEFKLDPNFIALSQLSTDDRGLADKRPAERKKFVNSIISSVEVYNNIYKTLSKRSSIFKSMINSIITKIDTIGDIDSLNKRYMEVCNEIAGFESNRNIVSQTMYRQMAKIEELDKDGRLSKKIELEEKLSNLKSKLIGYANTLKEEPSAQSSEEARTFLNQFEKKVSELDAEYSLDLSRLDDINAIINRLSEEALEKSTKLESIGSESNQQELEAAIEATKRTIAECEKFFKDMGLQPGTILTKDEYVIGINTLEQIKEAVESFQEAYSDGLVQDIIASEGKSLEWYPVTQLIMDKILDVKNSITQYKELYANLITKQKIARSLSERPEKCTINTCPFIAEAIMAQEELDLHESPEDIANVIKVLETREQEINDNINHDKMVAEGLNHLNRIFRYIESSRGIISKLPVSDLLLDKASFVVRIISRIPLKEIDILKQYLHSANTFEDYAYAKNMLTNLEADYKIYMSKKDLIDSLTHEISNLKEKIAVEVSEGDKTRRHMLEVKKQISEYRAKVEKWTRLLDVFLVYESIINEIEACNVEYNKSLKAAEDIISLNDRIALNDAEIKRLTLILDEKYKDKNTLSHKIKMLEEYQKEYTEYKASYDKIETIKYYSSPTTGIQTLFMELYMNKIIQLANKLLAMLFDGVFHLEPFIINENEFRIPCSGGNLPHDDISSMSSSQVACISMILSFALLFQSSSKLNILKLDEIDGALDSANRRHFIIMLEQMLEVLNCQQCIIISHNDEINLDNCDVILLKHSNIEPVNGNIIWYI